MANQLNCYLDSVISQLRLDPSSQKEIGRELYAHLEDRVEELKKAGLTEEEAAKVALQSFGSDKAIAQQMYQVHSRGNWRQALLAAIPHFLFALLFILHFWQNIGWLAIILTFITGVAAYGWWHGKPAWIFSWLGYSLLPVIIVGLFLLALPTGWSWLALLIYVPLTIWLLASIATQTVRKDWIYGSLMLLPIPTLAGWLLAIEQKGQLLKYDEQRLSELAPWIALSFLALAIIAVTFIRLGQRQLRIGILLAPQLLLLMMVSFPHRSSLGFLGLLILALLSLGLLLSPALLERRKGCRQRCLRRSLETGISFNKVSGSGSTLQ